MNQQEINKILDEMMMKAEKDIEVVFANRLKAILDQMLQMHKKFGSNGEASWTDVNKYNRFNQEMARIAKELNADYKKIIKMIQESEERLYVERYLMMAYLLQQSTGEEMGFRIPTVETIEEALVNPIEFLTLPKIFESHRNEIIRRLNIEIAQSLQAGESYTDMAVRIENAMGWTRKKAILVARTEGGRVRSQADLAVEEQMRKIVEERASKSTEGQTNKDSKDSQSQANKPVKGTSSKSEAEKKSKTAEGQTSKTTGKKTSESTEEQTSRTVNLTKVWMSSLDTRVRKSHRKLDGQKADKDGYFHYGTWKSKAPRLWNVASMDIQCRCTVLYLVNDKFPEVRRGRDYMDDKYQQKLADRIEAYMADLGMTYRQAFNRAYKEVKPPSVVVPFMSYEEWRKQFSGEG